MAEEDSIHKDLYDKVNANTNAVAALTATVNILTQQNEKFFDLVEKKDANFMRALRWFGIILSVIIFALLFALIYGAIGAEGLRAVRESMPTKISSGTANAIPWDDPLADFKRRRS